MSIWKHETPKVEELAISKTYGWKNNKIFVTVVVKSLQGTTVTCWRKSHSKLMKTKPSKLFKIPDDLMMPPINMFTRTMHLPKGQKWIDETEERVWEKYDRIKKKGDAGEEGYFKMLHNRKDIAMEMLGIDDSSSRRKFQTEQ
jgi:hypothetical protein